MKKKFKVMYVLHGTVEVDAINEFDARKVLTRQLTDSDLVGGIVGFEDGMIQDDAIEVVDVEQSVETLKLGKEMIEVPISKN